MPYLTIAQILVSLLIIFLVLIQERSAGAGGLFGGAGGEFYQKRRGFEKIIFLATIISLAVFASLSISSLILK